MMRPAASITTGTTITVDGDGDHIHADVCLLGGRGRENGVAESSECNCEPGQEQHDDGKISWDVEE